MPSKLIIASPGFQKTPPNLFYKIEFLDLTGYAHEWRSNLISSLSFTDIAHDFGSGAGWELDFKLWAAHSSAAFVVNSFGRWRPDPRSLRIAGATGFTSLRFEAIVPTGLRGTPPHLDVLADGDLPVAVESKCTEWMDSKPAVFSASYDTLKSSHGQSPWFRQIRDLRDAPDRYRFLDAAQLVKHALGLITRYGNRNVSLVYLYWEPSNSADWPQCRAHREESEDFAGRISGSNIRLLPVGFSDLWNTWERDDFAAPDIEPMLAYLRLRYVLHV